MRKIAVVGVTGVVGQEIVKVLRERNLLNDAEVVGFASRTRESKNIWSLDDHPEKLSECDVVFNATDSVVAEKIRSLQTDKQLFIDNSSKYRMDSATPLVVPEINGNQVQSKQNLYANPNCTACILTMALAPLKNFGIERVLVSTYQSASGAGIKGLNELAAQFFPPDPNFAKASYPVFGFPLMGNVLSHNSDISSEGEAGAGYNVEENKVVEETKKILNLPNLQISATCIRVPVVRAHAESVSVDLKKDISLTQLREAFVGLSAIKVIDNWSENHFPMPIEAQDQDLVLVGRLRKDLDRPCTVHMFIAGDQLRKGAATNAVQIYEAYLALKD